jgi:hypothetical protein
MHQNPLAPVQMPVHERNSVAQHGGAHRAMIVGRKVQEHHIMPPEQGFVVAGFRAQVDDGADTVDVGQRPRVVRRKAASDRQVIGQPGQVGLPGLGRFERRS